MIDLTISYIDNIYENRYIIYIAIVIRRWSMHNKGYNQEWFVGDKTL